MLQSGVMAGKNNTPDTPAAGQDLVAEVASLTAQRDEARAYARELKDKLDALASAPKAVSRETFDRSKLRPVNLSANCPTVFFDGSKAGEGFFYYESTTFKNDSGWSESVIRDRCLSAIGRAVGDDSFNRLGKHEEFVGGRYLDAFTMLPAFSPEYELEVTVALRSKRA